MKLRKNPLTMVDDPLQVLFNVGLCIMLKDLVSLGDSIILPGDGSSHTEVVFRYIVFRPQIGEVVTGKIRCCSREGVHGEIEWRGYYVVKM